MSDTILLKGIEVPGAHGVLEEERSTIQTFRVDLKVEEDTAIAAAMDEMTNTIWYEDLVQDVVTEFSGPSVRFMETLASRIAERIISRGALFCEVTVHKPNFKAAAPVEDTSITVRHKSPLFDDELGIRRAVIAITSYDPNDGTELVTRAVEEVSSLDVYVSAASDPYVTEAIMPGRGRETRPMTTLIAVAHTAMSPMQLAKNLQNIEVRLGRQAGSRLMGRRIDIQMLTFGSLESQHPKLMLPNPMAMTNAAYLHPWLQIDPEARVNGVSVQSILDGLNPGTSAS